MPLHEYTTVTRKLRRLGRFDWSAAARAAQLNRPTRIAVNFLDYLDFKNHSASDWSSLTAEAKGFVALAENACGASASYLGTGPRLSNSVGLPAEKSPGSPVRPNCGELIPHAEQVNDTALANLKPWNAGRIIQHGHPF